MFSGLTVDGSRLTPVDCMQILRMIAYFLELLLVSMHAVSVLAMAKLLQNIAI